MMNSKTTTTSASSNILLYIVYKHFTLFYYSDIFSDLLPSNHSFRFDKLANADAAHFSYTLRFRQSIGSLFILQDPRLPAPKHFCI
jgi:hypothetical protein